MAFGLGFTMLPLKKEPTEAKGPLAPCVVDPFNARKGFEQVEQAPGNYVGLWVACVGGHVDYVQLWRDQVHQLQVDYGECRYGQLYVGGCGRVKRLVVDDQAAWDAAFRMGGPEAVAAMFDKAKLARWRKPRPWEPR